MQAILMTEEYWRTSQFSAVKYTGSIKINDHEYVIVNKEGKDIFQCSHEAEKAGREKAIEPGEPCDLIRVDFIPYYKKLGREHFIDVLKRYPTTGEKELIEIFINESKL